MGKELIQILQNVWGIYLFSVYVHSLLLWEVKFAGMELLN